MVPSKRKYRSHYDHALVTIAALGIIASALSILFVVGGSLFAITFRRDSITPPTTLPDEHMERRTAAFFERNEGQFRRGVDAVLRQSKASVALSPSGFTDGEVTQTIIGARKRVRATFLNQGSSTTNYLLGNNQKEWRTGVANYAMVRYKEIYPGIDVAYRTESGALQYQFELNPGADPDRIILKLKGLSDMSILPGAITGTIQHTRVTIDRLRAYQISNGDTTDVEVAFKDLGSRRYGFALGTYDKALPLVIDPEFTVVGFSTYWGGSLEDGAFGHGDIELDADGNVYVVSNTLSTNFPTSSPYQATLAGEREAVIAKFSNNGTLLTSTYFGGTGDDSAQAIVVANNSVYVSGLTRSPDFPTVAAYQSSLSGTQDSFISRFNLSLSSLMSSTYFGGTGTDFTYSMTADANGNIFPCLSTSSTDMPTAAAFQSSNGGGQDTFIARFDASVSSLGLGTYVGGSSQDIGCRIVVNEGGQIYAAMTTTSTNFPTLNAYQAVYGGASSDIGVTSLYPSGTLAYSTYLGGSGSEQPSAIVMDGALPVVSGFSNSANYPILNAYQSSRAGGSDGIITKFNASGSTLAYSTYLGGTGTETSLNIALDADRNVYFGVYTNSSNFPMMNAIQSAKAGGYDHVFGMLGPNAGNLRYATYYGGALDETSGKIALDASRHLLVYGVTKSTDLPVTSGAFQTVYGGGVADLYVAKIIFAATTTATTGGGGGAPAPRVALVIPRGLEVFTSGEDIGVTWIMQSIENIAHDIRLSLTVDGGKTYQILAEHLSLDLEYRWVVPAVFHTTPAKMKIEILDSQGNAVIDDQSDYFFDIKPKTQ